ncbi:type II toxin-antitoxin system VapC family toxin [Synechococcus sp. CBW1108]|jgi:predicted nucleic-acid-binding protein|uniref:type II toxin-antitoxin system VapC family toxin n=1 Tax=Synechococcus sp. CBW1108 TaxID=1353147 RepID=UPI0018CFD24C|nr:type II toxin-antitoxin system VapC family toxin [Synechococcus sp. CBW1108]QPN68957.1 type II toxin-antitoxin system VapC family toxin [Synechococcus sp. CBW1108]
MSLPVALDTNLLVRLLTNDDPEQARRVADLIDDSSACFVPITVVLELEWVLRGAYQLPREAIIGAFRGLIAIRHLHLEQEEQVLQALEAYGQGLDFADALHLLRSEGCAALVSFDRAFAAKAGELALTPAVQQL